jgi:hypothetical protein
VISFGFFEGDRDDLERMRSDDALRSLRKQQLERINEHVGSTGTDGVFEVVEVVDFRRD